MHPHSEPASAPLADLIRVTALSGSGIDQMVVMQLSGPDGALCSARIDDMTLEALGYQCLALAHAARMERGLDVADQRIGNSPHFKLPLRRRGERTVQDGNVHRFPRRLRQVANALETSR